MYSICGPLSAAAAAAGCPSFVAALLLLYCCCCSELPGCCSFCWLLCCQGCPLRFSCCNCCCCCLLRMLGRTIVCSAVLPSPGLELSTALLALANQQLSLLGRTCLTRPCQDSMAASLSLVRNLICSLDQDRRQTCRIHPDCPCPPIAVLQPPTTYYMNYYSLQ